jgi:CubicO group peptidase (beta-lactamase class C family)
LDAEGRRQAGLLAVAALTLAHLVDHVLRADASGWPFTGEVTWFTASLVLFPVLVAGILLLRPAAAGERARPPRRPAGRARPGGFLRSTGTTAFLAVKGDTLVAEAYFHGYRHDSTVSSFSVAKPVVSALVGIAIAQGRIGSVDDPVTRYLPELARRDPRFGRITLRHLLTMSSGLADLDPYYDLDLRAVALRHTRIVQLPGLRFRYNNVNPVLLGMVLERTAGASASAYLAEQLWGPLGMEADGSWSLDSRRSGLELLQAGLNGRAVDFAKLGALAGPGQQDPLRCPRCPKSSAAAARAWSSRRISPSTVIELVTLPCRRGRPAWFPAGRGRRRRGRWSRP